MEMKDLASQVHAAKQQFSTDHAQLLETHLLAQIGVEFFTIPFYLTAVYSFTDAALQYAEGNSYPLYDLQQKTLSVAVQEMYHLQEASNLANAFGLTPSLPDSIKTFDANTQITIPHLDPGDHPLKASLGNLPHAIQTMIEIETPDDSGTYPTPNSTATYPSIGDLYHATLQLLAQYLSSYQDLPAAFDPHFQPGNKQVAYPAFAARYTYNKIQQRSDVKNAANAIVDQGEGPDSVPQDSGFEASHGCDVLPQYQSHGGRFASYDTETHYCRFEDIQQALQGTDWKTKVGKDVFYAPSGTASPDLPSWAPDLNTCQQAVNVLWSYLVDTMMQGLADGTLSTGSNDGSSGPSFTSVMTSFKYTLPLIWQHGACPSFVYTSGVTAQQAQQAMDNIDPLCLFHWDDRTQQVRATYPKNACQGLNACAGQGWGGIATKAGDGACATADFHTCQGSNDCKAQGGCGFLSTVDGSLLSAEHQWVPDLNACNAQGGCQTPISNEQVFDSSVKFPKDWSAVQRVRLEAQKGRSVWETARILFALKHGPLPTPKSETIKGIDYDGTQRRAAVAATSKS